MEYMNSVLIIGSGAREHAIVKALLRCDRPLCMFAYPGNPGMEGDGCTLVTSKINGWDDLADWALQNEIELTVVGPEIPLVDGIVDIFRKRNLSIFGPSLKAARIEGSKSFAKQIMKKYNVPTAGFEVFTEMEKAILYVKKKGAPVVVKADGLAAGKGVSVCETAEEAEAAIRAVLEKKIFGEAGSSVVIEEKMEGEEASVFVLTDGKSYRVLPVSQDHKRALDGDKGPNTGGMGAYAPSLLVDEDLLAVIEKKIIVPVLDGMKKEDSVYRGLIYIGIMVTGDGPKVVEFNCRLGDPETQSVLPLVECDWFDVFKACSAGTGELSTKTITIREGFCVAVVLTSKGYPGKYAKGLPITGIEKAEALNGSVDVYHAGTAVNEKSKLVTGGGRVLTVSAVANDLRVAVDMAYKAADKIKFEGKTLRMDIAAKGLRRIVT
jgi:phosphoribosylamine---glycine ligase